MIFAELTREVVSDNRPLIVNIGIAQFAMTPPTSASPSTSSRSSSGGSGSGGGGGIDIRDALTILSARAATSHHHLEGDAIPPELRRMGQTIDMTTTTTTTGSGGGGGGTGNEEEAKEEKTDDDDDRERNIETLERTRARRSEEIREKLSSMSTSELIKTIFAAQEERVATYRTFEA